jgi:UDP-GlcNAc:undecaprenyl-phosphate/decaprenyl-phosphate GlcNAc-1-phosphate transferase
MQLDLFMLKLVFSIFITSFLLLELVKRICYRSDWVSKPRSDRWSRRITALHGGVGFFPVILAGMIYVAFNYSNVLDLDNIRTIFELKQLKLLQAILVGSVLLFIMGLLDDVYNFKPIIKIFLQLIAVGIYLNSGGMFVIFEANTLNLFITCIWIIGVTNAVNLMDNMDGLSSGVVLIASIFFIIISMSGVDSEIPLLTYIGVILSTSLLAFLFFNWQPASIFMGDSGSLSIGFLLATLLIPCPINNFLGINQDHNVLTPLLSLLIPLSLAAVVLFDLLLVSITRLLNNKKITQGGQDHASHRLVFRGLSERKAVLVLYLFSIISGSTALLLQRIESLYAIFFITLIFAILIIITGFYLGRTILEKNY